MRSLLLPVLCGWLFWNGCAHHQSGSQTSLDEPLPPGWSADGAAVGSTLDGWLASWNDPGLMAAAQTALANNRDLRAAAHRVEAAWAGARVQAAEGIPNLGLSGSGGRRRSATGGNPAAITSGSYTGSLVFDWEVDLWGRIRDGRWAARKEAEGAVASFEAARLSLVAQVAKIWFRRAEAKAQKDLLEANAQAVRRQAGRVARLFELGLADALEARLLAAQAEASTAAALAQEAAGEELDRVLRVLLGQYPEASGPWPATLPELPPPVEAGIPSDLLSRRPDIRSSESQLAAQEARVRATRKLRLPSFSLTGSAGRASDDLSRWVSEGISVWSILGQVSNPLFNAGSISASISRQQALYLQTLANYQQTVLQALEEVETALGTEPILLARSRALQEAAMQSEAAETMAWQRYERGMVEVVTVLEAQRRAYEARSAWISVRSQLHQNRVDLVLALGGDPMPPRPDPEETQP